MSNIPEESKQSQQPDQANQDGSAANDSLDFERESAEEMKAIAKGLMVDLVWTLSGMNKTSVTPNQSQGATKQK